MRDYKTYCRYKNANKRKGYKDVPSMEGKTSLEEGVDVYLFFQVHI